MLSYTFAFTVGHLMMELVGFGMPGTPISVQGFMSQDLQIMLLVSFIWCTYF